MFKEFRSFIYRGNVVDLAVAVALGAAFSAVVNSLVNDVVMNAIAAVFGKPDFSNLTFRIGDGVVRYGNFLTALVNFLLVGTVLFMLIQVVNRATRPLNTPPPDPPKTRECPFCISLVPIGATRCPACTSTIEAEPARV